MKHLNNKTYETIKIYTKTNSNNLTIKQCRTVIPKKSERNRLNLMITTV